MQQSIYPPCPVQNVDINELMDEHELYYGASLVDIADFSLIGLPFNVCQVQKDDRPVYDGPGTNFAVDASNFGIS